MRATHLFSLLLLTASCQGQLNFFYTGRTLGYFRMPDQQDPAAPPGCPAVSAMNPAAAELYASWRNFRQGASPILVGMGDNFGPEFDARNFASQPASGGPGVPRPAKDLYFWNNVAWVLDGSAPPAPAPNSTIPTDNVGCFMRAMGYTALTPGKHDFYAGPDRLRAMARFVYAGYPADPAHPGPSLLGANLSIATAAPDDKPRMPLYQVEIDLRHQMTHPAAGQSTYTIVPPEHEDDPAPSITFPDVVLPYLRKFEVDNAYYLMTNATTRLIPADVVPPAKLDAAPYSRASPTHLALPVGPIHLVTKDPPNTVLATPGVMLRVDGLQICENPTDPPAATGPRDPYAFTPPGQCWDVPVVPPEALREDDDFKSGKIRFAWDHEMLSPDRNYAACIHLVAGAYSFKPGDVREYYCIPFYVAEPFFSHIQSATGVAGVPVDDPFAIDPGSQTAIFGLLDPDLQGKIGRMNYGWLNQPRFETTVQFGGLSDALKQAMMRCELVAGCNQSKNKILLAQMPVSKAAQFLASVTAPRFDLVVSETDTTNQTLPGTFEKTVENSTTSPRFVVAPAEIYSPGFLKPKIYRAQTSTPGGTGVAVPGAPVRWRLDNSASPDCNYPIPTPPMAPGSPSNLRSLAIATLANEGVHPLTSLAHPAHSPFDARWSSAQTLQRLALTVMQRSSHTDISLLQARDFFRPEVYGQVDITPGNLQEILDRLFWKGDFVVSMPVTGATLTAIQQASMDFATLDQNPTNTDLEKQRSLVTLGVFKESAEKTLVVNGGFVDPARLYSVAMTDFLALGDTGYPQLKTPVVPYPYRMKDFRRLDSLGAMVCRGIRDAVLPGAQCYPAALDAGTYLDISQQLPPDTTKGMTQKYQTRSYVFPLIRIARYGYFYRSQNEAEIASSNKRYWTLDLEKGDFGLNISLHKKSANQSISQTMALTNEYAGITVPSVTAPNSYALSFDDRVRLKYRTPRWDMFALNETNYSFSRTQDSKDDAFARSLTQNSLASEGGILAHFWPLQRQAVQWDVLASGRLETQVLSPREDVSLSAGALHGTLRRSRDLFLKAGLRISDTRSWIETGYLWGRSFENPYQVLFNGNLAINLIPGCQQCSANPYPTATPPGSGAPLLDQIAYYNTLGQIDATSTVSARYKTRPLSGYFLNFSLNVPLPFGNTYADYAGKPMAFLAENNGRFFWDNSGDLKTQTKLYDKLALSLVLPVLGNLSFKPEVDLIYYYNKVELLPFHSITYMGTLSYTFSWAQGQPWNRVWRYASPAPTVTVPASGR